MSELGVQKFGDVCDITMGQAPPGSTYNLLGDGLPLVAGAGNFGNRTPVTEKFTSTPLKTASPGDIILCVRATIGDINWSDSHYCLGRGVAGLRPKKDAELDSKFLWYWLCFVKPVLRRLGKGATFLQVTKSDIENLKIPCFPLKEQRRIAEILEASDMLQAKAAEALTEVDKLQQSVFLDMFGDPVTNSKRWIDTEELCDHATISSGITKGRRLREARVTPVPYLAVSNVQDQRIVLEHVKTIEATSEEIRRYALEKGDILLTEGGDPDKLGRGAIWEGQINPCIHQNHVFKVRLNSNVLRREFLSALLSSARGKRYFLRGAKQTTGIASINMSQLKKFPLLIPPLELQDTYAVFLDQLSTQRQILETQSAEMEMLFKSLLQRAFSRDL